MIETLNIAAELLLDTLSHLKNNAQNDFDMLVCISARDTGEKIELSYFLFSTKQKKNFILSTQIDYAQSVESAVKLYKSADWDEREIFDLLGVNFNNHPNLERLLLPKDWVGHPLRKDYEMNDARLKWNN